ncbi:CD99 molecule isoform X1 [Scyliorhinus canicula]|uniref:CD99 molecule isoform X1 n=1 Tax=Scyliorhinus canicula TaxID=7830 RepID=UPI0018F7A768|nr:CD99 molecule isoform X1 [Scyliorhinus canicula]
MLLPRTLLFIGLAFVFVGTKAAPTLGVNDTGDDGFDLNDAFKDDPPAKTPRPGVDPNFPDVDLDFRDPKDPVLPKKPNSSPDELDLNDAVHGEDKYTPTKRPKQPPKGDPDRQFGDDDLVHAAGDAYNPDRPNAKDRGRASGQDSGQTNEAGSKGTLAGIISGVLLALGGAVSSYVLYQKKKLCFSMSGNSAEQGNKQENVHGQREDPQSYNTLLKSQPAGSN